MRCGLCHCRYPEPDPNEDDDTAAANYFPQPYDTAQVSITPAIQDLINMLARQTHEIWARDKIEEGWKYAPDRPMQRRAKDAGARLSHYLRWFLG